MKFKQISTHLLLLFFLKHVPKQIELLKSLQQGIYWHICCHFAHLTDGDYLVINNYLTRGSGFIFTFTENIHIVTLKTIFFT